MEDHTPSRVDAQTPAKTPRVPWNKGKLVGAKPQLRPSHVWSVSTKLRIEGKKRDLAHFNLASDSKRRGCDVVAVRVDDVAPSGYPMDRATIRQKTTGRPVRFELAHQTRQAIDEYLRLTGRKGGQFLFAGRGDRGGLTTRQYSSAHAGLGGRLRPRLREVRHSLRRTKAVLIYRQTGNHRAVPLLLGIPRSNRTYDTLASRLMTLSRSPRRSISDRRRDTPDSRHGRRRILRRRSQQPRWQLSGSSGDARRGAEGRGWGRELERCVNDIRV